MLKRAAFLALSVVVVCAGILYAADEPSNRKTREFVMADSPQSLSLDPLHTFTSFESQFYTAIYEGLVVADPQTLEPVPGVAKSWESSKDGRVWTFSPPARRPVFQRGPCPRA